MRPPNHARQLLRQVDLLSLELTNACNLECSFCASRIMSRKKGFMDLALAKRLLKEAKDTHFAAKVVTSVMGDPLLYRDLLPFLAYAKEINQALTVITNGERLDNAMCEGLFAFPPQEVGISYHAGDEASYRYKGSRSSYAEYEEKIRAFVELKFKLGVKTVINLNVMTTMFSPIDKFSILQDAAGLEAFKGDWLAWANRLKETCHLRFRVPRRMFIGANMLLPGFLVTILSGYHSWSGLVLPSGTRLIPSPEPKCACPFTQCNVLWNGDMTLCCIDYDGCLVYGNAQESSLLEAFNSPAIADLRRRFLEKRDIPEKCAVCSGRLVRDDGSDYVAGQKAETLGLRDRCAKACLDARRLLRQRTLAKTVYTKVFAESRLGKRLMTKRWSSLYGRSDLPAGQIQDKSLP